MHNLTSPLSECYLVLNPSQSNAVAGCNRGHSHYIDHHNSHILFNNIQSYIHWHSLVIWNASMIFIQCSAWELIMFTVCVNDIGSSKQVTHSEQEVLKYLGMIHQFLRIVYTELRTWLPVNTHWHFILGTHWLGTHSAHHIAAQERLNLLTSLCLYISLNLVLW